jgi:phage gp36-like protein
VAYATQADIDGAFGVDELRQIAPDGSGGVDNLRVTAAADRAAALADGYLSTRYVTPIAAPGADLIGATADIARFYLYDDQATEEVRKRRDDAVAWLRDVSTGKAGIAGATVIAGATGERPAPVVIAPAEVFTAARMATMAPWTH